MDEFEEGDIEFFKFMQPKEFIKRMAEKYQIDMEKFARLFKDFDPVSREYYNTGELDAVPHDFAKISELSGMSISALRRLQHLEVISRPITFSDMDFIGRLIIACGDINFLRTQISKLSYQRREDLILRPELSSKWERWAYKRFFSPDIEYGDGGRMINPEKRIKIFDLAEQIESMFGVPNSPKTRERLKKIRTMAFNDRRKMNATGTVSEEIAEKRGVAAEEMRMALGLWETPKNS